MLDLLMLYQLARDPLQMLARKMVCRSLTLATNGRHRCPRAPRGDE